ncbi:MAG TPA: hypothetical protein PLW32_13845 [Chitinophagaceae bacterium]|nr:hypothetical protein [Chitinophagaceae bacterium]
MKKYKPGVLFGEELRALYQDAKEISLRCQLLIQLVQIPLMQL